jgi:rod shape-determining protein MreD
MIMGSFSTLAERADASVRMIVPYALMALIFLMCIYYWSIYRPALVPVVLVFAAGILMDLLGGVPLGFNALIFVLMQWVVTDQRRFLLAQPFVMIWVVFAFLSLAAMMIQWALFGLAHFNWPSLKPLGFSFIMGVAVFPAIFVLLHLTHKILPSPGTSLRFSSQS